jgi:hypothetical protein
LPLLHKSDALFADAANRRRDDEAAFFAALNAGATADSGWGAMADRWTPQTYDRAVGAPVGDSERERLASDLVATMFTGYTSAGEWLDISDGLGVMTTHAKSLGYEGLVLFLDELVLWLASRLNDQKFVSEEGSKVAKLVETGIGQRDIPIISFVARQRELQDFYAESTRAEGAQTSAVGDTFRYWENRFDTIILKASNLPDIAQRRLLTPVDQRAAEAVAEALATLKANRASWDALMRDEAQSDEVAFAKVYPFSPALVDTLVFLSGLLQRERTALKVMALLLCEGRTSARITQIIPRRGAVRRHRHERLAAADRERASAVRQRPSPLHRGACVRCCCPAMACRSAMSMPWSRPTPSLPTTGWRRRCCCLPSSTCQR